MLQEPFRHHGARLGCTVDTAARLEPQRHRAEREKPDLTAADAMLGVEAPPKRGAHECDLLGSGAFADVIS